MKHTKEVYDLFEVTGINGHNEDSKIAIKGSQLDYYGNDTDLVIVVDGLLDDLAPLLNTQLLEALKEAKQLIEDRLDKVGLWDSEEDALTIIDQAIKNTES